MKRHTKEQIEVFSNIIPELVKTDSYIKIAQSLNISTKTVWKILKQNNGVRKNQNICDHKYFDYINTSEKAQLLGMLLADGSISKRGNGIALSLMEKDIRYIEHFKKCLQASHPIIKNIKTRSCKITVISKQIKESLKQWSIVPNKTYKNLEMPPIDEIFIPPFILGLFEGDGCIGSYEKNNTRDNVFMILVQENIALFLKNYLERRLNIEVKLNRKKECNNNLFVLCIRKSEYLIKLYHFLYDSTAFVMKRKHDKWLSLMNIFKDKGYDVGILRSFQ